ncbi:glycosyltransferase [Carboxylicivirga sp. N1Y90]|uniref:glycosyltransferase n=1 Tax=Carboxylicivirga fragile TaxID=3417571 RepID=UPI003D32E57F|nr:glycosyltransferase [Marinilabiliaceae bacterium N1Y90]
MSNKRICLVIPSLQAGGMERVMSELAAIFSAKPNVEVHLILYGITREMFFSVPDNITIHKPAFEFNNKKRFFSTVKTLFFLRKKVKQLGPDTLLSFGEYWNNFFLLSLLGLNYKTYVSDRSQPDKSLGKLHDALRHWLYPKATGVILQTERGKDIFLKHTLHDNIAVIGNPIREIKMAEPELQRDKVVVMVGRLIKSKNQDRLIQIFAKIANPDWKLMLVGYDHLKQNNMDRLKQLASDLNIAEQVIFTGKQNNIDEILNKSSIFAFTSSSEGFPNVIGEAMSSGLPVIAYDCNAGPAEMINDGNNGFLIPLFNDDLFETNLSKLMDDATMRAEFGVQGQSDIKAFSKEHIGERFYNFITQKHNR